ncbi:hypothetical protein BROUX41_003569 [Berkeleyomyces rouxiae]|uniref:uncharacterized protein n=1 Tax=Berkeleyomyces rouxiae TaxID=2035830 RepID=UPI003B7BB64A
MADHDAHKRSNSRSRTPHPTTPLRPSSRSSFRDSARAGSLHGASFPLNVFEPHFADFSDAMADLEANLMHFQIMHESLARFSESFASFMYGLNMNAFCVDFPEGPIPESFTKPRNLDSLPFPDTPRVAKRKTPEPDDDVTFMSPNGDFAHHPTSSKASRLATPEPPKSQDPGRGGPAKTTRGARGTTRGTASARGGYTRGSARGTTTTSSRGTTRGRGLQAPRARGLR